jgi:hypothetical protein
MFGYAMRDFQPVPAIIPPLISNRIYTFPKYAVSAAFYPELEGRNVVSRVAVAG